MPDIGMVDLITPIQAGANIVAQANNIRRQREQMVLQRMQAQQRTEELRQLGIVRQNEAQKAQYELQTEKEKKAARLLFSESFQKAYSEFVNTKPNSTEEERQSYALRTALPNAHPDDVPDIIKSISASASVQDKNAIAMQNAIARMESNARLADFKIDNLTARIEHYQKQAEQASRTLDERTTFHEAMTVLQQQKQQAERERDQSKEAADFVKGQTKAGIDAFNAVIKNPSPTALQDATTAKTREERVFEERWNREHGYRVPQTTTTNAKPMPSPKDSGDEGNVDTEANQDGNEMVIPPSKNKPKSPESKKLKWDDSQGLVPR